MGERKFDIVFDGSVINGSDPLQVKAKVQQLFKLDDAAAERLFTGAPIVIKKSVDRKTATQFQTAMNKAGARVQLVMHKDASEKNASSAEENASAPPQRERDTKSGSNSGENVSGKATWTVAEASGPLLQAHERATIAPVEVNTDHITLEQSNSNPFLDKLDTSERNSSAETLPSYPAPKIDKAPDLALKDAHEIESEIDRRETEQEAELAANQARFNTEFAVAEAGADLLAPNEKKVETVLEIDLSQLSLSDPI